jgi:hypothetical protein
MPLGDREGAKGSSRNFIHKRPNCPGTKIAKGFVKKIWIGSREASDRYYFHSGRLNDNNPNNRRILALRGPSNYVARNY